MDLIIPPEMLAGWLDDNLDPNSMELISRMMADDPELSGLVDLADTVSEEAPLMWDPETQQYIDAYGLPVDDPAGADTVSMEEMMEIDAWSIPDAGQPATSLEAYADDGADLWAADADPELWADPDGHDPAVWDDGDASWLPDSDDATAGDSDPLWDDPAGSDFTDGPVI